MGQHSQRDEPTSGSERTSVHEAPQQRWRAETPTASNIQEINRLYAARCRQLGIIYADISLRVQPPKAGTLDPNGGWATEPSCTLA